MKKYEKPIMIKIGSPMYAKSGMAPDQFDQIREEICGHRVSDLTDKFGSPLFVLDQSNMIEKYHKTLNQIKEGYPNVKFGWSYKTNYLRAVCQTFHNQGALAEVVSDFEYEKALNLGVSGADIIYNGPYKSKDSLMKAVRHGSIINIDHFGEIEDLEEVSKILGTPVKVGIRINFNSGIYPQWSRFGFNLESGQAWNAVKRIQASQHLKIIGVHSHIGTFVMEHKAYGIAARNVVDFILKVESITGEAVQFIDLGGGFASFNRLKGVYQAPEIAIPSIDQYARSLTEPLQLLAQRSNPPTLYMELGRHLVDEAGFLITSVVGDKMLPEGRRNYILDAGVNILYTASWYRYFIESETPISGMLEPATLTGPLCMNIDVVDECIMLPRLPRGHRLVISPVGAYNQTQSMQFIRYRPATVMILEDGRLLEIKAAENLNDIEANERDLPKNEKFRVVA